MDVYQSWPPDGEAEAQESQRGTQVNDRKLIFSQKHQNSEAPRKERRETDVILQGKKGPGDVQDSRSSAVVCTKTHRV